ncbi:MAG: hypothetical protein ACR2LN_00230 [Candidatus Levyibacteriota bacterium]
MAKGASLSVASAGAKVGGGAAPKISLGGGVEQGSGSSLSKFSSKGLANFSPGRSEFSGPKTTRYGSAMTAMESETLGPRASIDKSAIRQSSEKFGGISKPDAGTAKMTVLSQPKSGVEQSRITVDQSNVVTRQPESSVLLQKSEPGRRFSEPLVNKVADNVDSKTQPIQRIWTDAPRRTTMPEVIPLTPTPVEPLIQPTAPEVPQLPIVENRPHLTTPAPTFPDRGVEQQAQRLVIVREQLHAAQTETVEEIKPITPVVTSEVRLVPNPKPADRTETAVPSVLIQRTAEPVTKVDLPTKKSKEAKTFYGLLKAKEEAKVDLENTVKQTGAVRAAVHSLPQRQELLAVEKAENIREYVVKPSVKITYDDVLLTEAEEEERKRLKEKQNAFKLLFRIRWGLSKLQLGEQTKTEAAVAHRVGITQLQELDQKRTQAVGLATPNHVQPEISTQTQQVATDLPVARETENDSPSGSATMVLIYQAKVTVQEQQSSADAPPEDKDKEEKAVKVYKDAQQNKLRQWFDAVARIFPAFDFVTTRRLREVAAAMDNSNSSTRSHVSLLGGIEYDGADEMFRRELIASEAKVTKSEAGMAGAEVIHSLPAGIVQEKDGRPELTPGQVKIILQEGQEQAKVAA